MKPFVPLFLLALSLCLFLGSCTSSSESQSTISYVDVVISPADREHSDYRLHKITSSGRVTLTSKDGLATARAGEYFMTQTGHRLWKLKSVDVKTGRVVIETILCGLPYSRGAQLRSALSECH